MSMRNSNDTIGNRTRDLPTGSAVIKYGRTAICIVQPNSVDEMEHRNRDEQRGQVFG